MRALEGRVAVITGAGRGIGRQHALLFAAEGARVVVNDLGCAPDGRGTDAEVAGRVVEEIRANGGEAVANTDDVTDADGAERLISTAIETFGDLHVLVNNAGTLRDRMVWNMSEEDFDDVVRTHLRGHFLPTRAAARHWRHKSKAGLPVHASLINTSSVSGLFGMVGQTNYGAAKSGIASSTLILQEELGRYGVRANAIAPAAITRLTQPLDAAGSLPLEGPTEVSGEYDPANVSPFVAYLATRDCPVAGRVFFVRGGEVHLFQPWSVVDVLRTEGRWTVDALEKEAPRLAEVEFDLNQPKWG